MFQSGTRSGCYISFYLKYKFNEEHFHRPNAPQFKMAIRVTSEHTYARNARARIRAIHVIGLLHTEVVWHTSQLPHAIWCSLTLPHRYWLCNGGWTLGIWANEISVCFLRRDQCLTYGNFAKNSLQNHLRTAFACRYLRLKYVYRC